MKPLVITRPLGDDPPTAKLYYGQDVRKTLRELSEASVHTVCTSPPYFGLRDYGAGEDQIGLEETPEAFVQSLVEVFREVKRVLRPDGTVWLNLGDSYSGFHGNSKAPDQEAPSNKNGYWENMRATTVGVGGLKPKDLLGIPWKVAFGLQADGWYLRAACPWIKGNCMPESVQDRPTVANEYVFLLAHPESKGRYHYDLDAVRVPHKEQFVQARKGHDPTRPDQARSDRRGDMALRYDGVVMGNPKGRNRRTTDWWMESLEIAESELRQVRLEKRLLHSPDGTPLAFRVNPKPYKGAHFAVWPPALVEPMVLAACPRGGVVLDPFSGSGTTGLVALKHDRNYIGIDLNEDYLELAEKRLRGRKAPKAETLPDGILDLL